MRVGVRWLGTLLDRDPVARADPPPQGPVTRYFAERTIEAPFNPKRSGLLPRSILEALASPAARIAQEDVGRAFGRFADDINTAARKGARPSATLAADAALIAGTHGPRVAFATFREPKGGRTVYGFRANTLLNGWRWRCKTSTCTGPDFAAASSATPSLSHATTGSTAAGHSTTPAHTTRSNSAQPTRWSSSGTPPTPTSREPQTASETANANASGSTSASTARSRRPATTSNARTLETHLQTRGIPRSPRKNTRNHGQPGGQ